MIVVQTTPAKGRGWKAFLPGSWIRISKIVTRIPNASDSGAPDVEDCNARILLVYEVASQ